MTTEQETACRAAANRSGQEPTITTAPRPQRPLTAQLSVPAWTGNRELLEAPGRLAFTKGLTQLLNAAYC